MKRFVLILIAGGLGIALLPACDRKETRTTLDTRRSTDPFAIGNVAPDIVGEDIDGKRMKLSDYRGKVVVLDFWGHW